MKSLSLIFGNLKPGEEQACSKKEKMTLLEKIDRGTLRTSSLALVPDNKSPRTANKLYWG